MSLYWELQSSLPYRSWEYDENRIEHDFFFHIERFNFSKYLDFQNIFPKIPRNFGENMPIKNVNV